MGGLSGDTPPVIDIGAIMAANDSSDGYAPVSDASMTVDSSGHSVMIVGVRSAHSGYDEYQVFAIDTTSTPRLEWSYYIDGGSPYGMDCTSTNPPTNQGCSSAPGQFPIITDPVTSCPVVVFTTSAAGTYQTGTIFVAGSDEIAGTSCGG